MESNIPESMSKKATEDIAWRHFFNGERRLARDLARRLIAEGNSGGYMLLGMIQEYGGDGIAIDFDSAITSYRSWAYAHEYGAPYRYLARVYLKKSGHGDLERAEAYLTEARKFEHNGALYLALGAYHECREEWAQSAKYNLIALFHGRILGMRRASTALSRAGYAPLGWVLRGLQIIVGPTLGLILGRRILEDF